MIMENKLYLDLVKIDTQGMTEKKNGMTYLSWAHAWKAFVKVCPNATYEVKKNENGLPYFKDDAGAMCYTSVTVDGLTHEMWLPVMDFKNKAVINPDMMQVNKTVMRCLTKNLAMFGLGLHIYAGEDLPEEQKEIKKDEAEQQKKRKIIAKFAGKMKEFESVEELDTFFNQDKVQEAIKNGGETVKAECAKAYKNKRDELLGA